MSSPQQHWIRAINLARVNGSKIVPTAIFYDQNRRPHIGVEAIDQCTSPEKLIDDFKIQLGEHNPDNVTKRTARSGAPRNTVVGIAQDYFNQFLKGINDWLETEGRPLPKNILIAEPLALSGANQEDENWLSNYRRSILRVLHNKFESVDFLPEPFAVFQYYRYGIRHPQVIADRKHVALVLDFGGGTFDISVVETTKGGDVSQTGKNSRPLGANSLQIGGFHLNRVLADRLMMEAVPSSLRAQVRRSMNRAREINSPEDLEGWSSRERLFYNRYRKILRDIETAKIAICNSVANWSLTADLSRSPVWPIDFPMNPYEDGSEVSTLKLDAKTIREVFENQVWKPRLRDAIVKSIERANSELKGKPISVVLMSGGSSNMRWLSKLIERDLLQSVLRDANLIDLSDSFQEVVAKGLATECTRRFYTEGEGDFRATTYNRLCLALKPDDEGIEIKRAKPITPELAAHSSEESDDGVLIPSAQSLRRLVGKPLTWKVRLSKPPKNSLEYFFLRSSFDPEDLDARHNIVDWRAETPRDAKFHGAIEVELTVREDGTAIPRFIYGRSDRSQGSVAEGKPFHIDMTFAAEINDGSTYLGFDFGTSSSACSFVDSKDVEVIRDRARSQNWCDLDDMVSIMPYPVAAPLAQFMATADLDRRENIGRSAAESMLTVAAYVAYMDVCSNGGHKGSHFKGFQHRSAGPLWGMLRNCLKSHSTRLRFAEPLLGLTLPENATQIDEWISGLNSLKHDKAGQVDWISFLELLGNHLHRIFKQKKLGIFESVRAKPFSSGTFYGNFRVLHGQSQPFVQVMEYEGRHAFSEEQVYLIDQENGTGICLSPLYFWGLNGKTSRPHETDLFEYDDAKREYFSFRSTQGTQDARVSGDGAFGPVHDRLSEMRITDQACDFFDGMTFKQRSLRDD